MTLSLPDYMRPSDGDYSFGRDFNYASWDANTELLLTNVPFNSDYRDIVKMDTQDAFNEWLDAKPGWKYTNSTLQKFNEGIVKIDLPINEAMKYNYLRARNGINPVSNTQRDYFYFITGIRYGAPETTYVSIQLDVISTFLYEVSFGQCYVEQGHIGIANANAFEDYGRDYLTVPESHDIGNEYRVVHAESERIMNTYAEDADITKGFDVLVCSTLDLTQDPGTLNNPHQNAARGAYFQGIPAGAEFYIFPSSDDLINFFRAYSDKPWITQSIISITLIPNMKRYYPSYDYGTNLSTYPLFKFYSVNTGLADGGGTRANPLLNNWRDKDFISNILGTEYRYLKKFLTFPYMVLELTTWSGSPLIIKPEAWQDANATIYEQVALLPPAQRIALLPHRYNWDSETASSTQGALTDSADDFGEYLDFATYLDNFVQVPVVNNEYINFLASNKNGIQFSFDNARWTQQRGLAAAGAAYDVQNAQIGNMGRQAQIANSAQTETANTMAQAQVVNSIIGAAGAVPGLATGAAGEVGKAGSAFGRASGGVASQGDGVMGAATGMMQAGTSAIAAQQAAQIAVGARANSAVSDIQTAGSVRDTNNAFATMAAKGDYKNAIEGVQARLQDAKMLQPSTSGQFNGDAFNLITGKFGYSLRFKMISKSAMRTVGNFWLRYGYAINQFMFLPDSLHCMSKFTYWKLQESYISQGEFPEGFKQIIRGIFEKGVTVWRNPDDIGVTSLSNNTPLNGIFY